MTADKQLKAYIDRWTVCLSSRSGPAFGLIANTENCAGQEQQTTAIPARRR